MESVAEWARLAASGDALAFRKLVDHATPTLFRVALRVLEAPADAWDVVQETCERAWLKLPGLREPDAVVGWMRRIARRAALRRLRERRRSSAEPLNDNVADDRSSPEMELVVAEASSTLQQGLLKLSDKHRAVILLREVDELSYEEMALALGCSLATVESRLHRARVALSRELHRQARRLAHGTRH